MSAGEKENAPEGSVAEGTSEGTSDSRRDPLVGTVVNGKYRVHSAIARGGMGRIYYATQQPLDRPVALKVVQGDGDHEHESQFLKRFLQEASILAKLQHPNVVTLFDYGQIEGSHVEQYFIAMEFLAGETLTHRLKNRPRLAAGETLILARQIARGLREAHKRGIIHRDLKPSNIILVPEGDGSEIVKLVDFGIGKMVGRPGDAGDLTQDGVFVGTPRYMAPEQFEGHAYPASDFYALGTIMFQALAGRLPFAGSTMSEFMVAKLARDVPGIRELAPDTQIPDSIEILVRHLLARRPEDRPSMEELHNHLMVCEEDVFGTPHSMRRGNSSGPHSFAQTGANFAQTGSGPYSMRQTGSNSHAAAVPPSGSAGAFGISGTQPQGWSAPHLPVVPNSQSSMPSLPYAGGDPLRVPHTMVAAIPNLAQITPRPMAMPESVGPQSVRSPSHGAQSHGAQSLGPQSHGPQSHGSQSHGPQSHPPQSHPPQSHASQSHPPQSAQPAGGSRTVLVVIAAGLVALCIILGAIYLQHAKSTVAQAPPASSSAPADTAAPPPADPVFTLTIESQPSGATVTEGETALGDTPLNVTIDRASVAAGPRTFVLRKEGFAPSQVVQGASTDSVHSVVALAPLSPSAPLAPDGSGSVKSRPPAPGRPVAQAPGPAKPPASAGPGGKDPGLDIRLKR